MNAGQKHWLEMTENSFAYVFDPKNYEVGNDKSAIIDKWEKLLEGPEPGFPGREKLHPYDEAIFGLAIHKSDKTLKLLVKIATEQVIKNNAHRYFATKALGTLGDPAAVPELIPLLYHYNVDVRWTAQISLVQLTGQNFGRDADAWGKWYNANRETLGKDLPAFDGKRVDWTCGSDNAEIKRWSDPKVQKEFDNRRFGEGESPQPGAAAPTVVKFEPANGAADVDAATVKELRVTFDVDMNTEGYSWTGGGEMFPKTPSAPKWIDSRTCVLPVDLESGKQYRLGINAPSFKNFRSASGVPVVPVLYSFSTKKD